MKAPIHSVKHTVQHGPSTIALGASLSVDMVSAVAPDAVTDPDEVVEGSIIKAVYLELWGSSDDVTTSSFIFTIEKQVGGIADITVGDMAALDQYPNKKNILYTSQGLFGPKTNTIPLPIFKGWIRIPKGKQRFGLNDVLVWNLSAVLDGIFFCGCSVYKSYD